jgi:hypothetical protein
MPRLLWESNRNDGDGMPVRADSLRRIQNNVHGGAWLIEWVDGV